MTKNEFMQQLAKELRTKNALDADDIAAEYGRYFACKLADGCSEEDIAAGLGGAIAMAIQFDEVDAPRHKSADRPFVLAGLCVANVFAAAFFALLVAWGIVMAAAAMAVGVALVAVWTAALHPFVADRRLLLYILLDAVPVRRLLPQSAWTVALPVYYDTVAVLVLLRIRSFSAAIKSSTAGFPRLGQRACRPPVRQGNTQGSSAPLCLGGNLGLRQKKIHPCRTSGRVSFPVCAFLRMTPCM